MDNTARQQEFKSSTPAKNGRLIGWLVSYADTSSGISHELRTGRYVLSGAGQKDNRTIVISERSISAPHAAMNALPKHKLMLQDIFSDQGTFVSRSGAKEEVRVTGPMEVNHGDWIRFGQSTRFQVCLIDGAGR